MQVRGRAGDLREPSIQLGDQEFETSHRLKFRKDSRRSSSVHDWICANFPASTREVNSPTRFRSSAGECVSASVCAARALRDPVAAEEVEP